MTELYSGTLMSEDSTDYIVPEYIPDTGKILLCTASPKITDAPTVRHGY